MSDTPHDLNLRIAEILETKPTHDPLEIEYGKHQSKPIAWQWEKCLDCDAQIDVYRADGTHGVWQPRPFDSDPAYAVMLMEHGGISVQVEPNPVDDEPKYTAYKLGTDFSVSGYDLKRCVAECFLHAHDHAAKSQEKGKERL